LKLQITVTVLVNLFVNAAVKYGMFDELDKGGNLHFMVNVVKPQFNLHSEEANVSDIEDKFFCTHYYVL
jgi:hypothetical protein